MDIIHDPNGDRVPEYLRSWDVPHPGYRPVDITPPELRPGEGLAASVTDGWAEPYSDPTRLPDLEQRRAAALIDYDVDEQGRPLNPSGRTGRIGRNLGRWGENAAADPIVVAGTGPGRRVLLIRRADCGQWAIPGGHVDPGETAPAALVRELREETGVELSHLSPAILATTHVADPRESDWAWITSTVALYQLPERVHATASDDATDAAWFAFTDTDTLTSALAEHGGMLYEAHRPLLNLALDRLDLLDDVRTWRCPYQFADIYLIGHLSPHDAAQAVAREWHETIEAEVEHVWMTFTPHQTDCAREDDTDEEGCTCQWGAAIDFERANRTWGSVFPTKVTDDAPARVAVTVTYSTGRTSETPCED